MFKNQISRLRSRQEGFNDAIIVAIIGGIVGSIFIAGVFAYKEAENQKILINSWNNLKKAVSVEDEKEDDWQVYKNEKYNYIMKFPSGWVSASLFDGSESDISNNENSSNYFILRGQGLSGGGFTVQVCTMFEFIECSPMSIEGWRVNKNIVSEELVYLGDEEFTKVILEGDETVWYVTENGNYFYTIRVQDVNNLQINSILSTFEFIDETDDWQTYTNENLGYTLKYPSDWTIKYIEQNGGYYSIASSEKYAEDSIAPGASLYLFNIFTFTDDISSLNLEESFPVTINGVEGVRGRESGIPHATVVILQQGNKSFKLSWRESNTNMTIEKILSTFKFLDETDDWQTYTNENLGYTLKYPSDYTVINRGDNTYWYDQDDDALLKVEYRLDSADGSLSTWFDTLPKEDIILGGRDGKKFIYKYCDGPGCGPETLAYVVQHKGKLLGLEFIGDYELSVAERKILSTFKFLDASNEAINAKLKSGELECGDGSDGSVTCVDLGYVCELPYVSICIEKGIQQLSGQIPEYTTCSCYDPSKDY